MPGDDEALCECGHPREAHDHYRNGTDCGVCGAQTCGSFRFADEQPVPSIEAVPDADTA